MWLRHEEIGFDRFAVVVVEIPLAALGFAISH